MQSRAPNTTYEAVSLGHEYLATNRAFVGRVPLGHVRRFLDLACGAGTVSRMLLEAAPEAHLNGLDVDPVQIDLATRELTRLGYEVRCGHALTDDRANGKPVVTLAVGPVDELPFPDGAFDCVTIANAIHMMPDKPRFLREAVRVLRPGGLFGFNSVFYAGSTPPGTEQHFIVWAKEAMAHLERLNEQRRAEGKEPIRRARGQTRKAFQNRWYSPQEWQAMLADAGFCVRALNERLVMLSVEALEAFGSYGGIAEVALSGYPVEAAAEALRATARAALAAMGLMELPRNWLEVWAEKG